MCMAKPAADVQRRRSPWPVRGAQGGEDGKNHPAHLQITGPAGVEQQPREMQPWREILPLRGHAVQQLILEQLFRAAHEPIHFAL